MSYKNSQKAKENRRARYLKHKTRIQAHNQKPDVKVRRQSLRREYFKANKEYFRAYSIKKKYGISYTQYLELIDNSNGKCPICLTVLVLGVRLKNGAVVDHDHITGKVRGIICNNCNRGIGLIPNAEALERAKQYVKG